MASGVRGLLALGTAVACLVGVPACGKNSDTHNLVGTTWQITAVYTDPSLPAGVPAASAGAAILVFSQSALVGNDGCNPLRAAVDYHDAHGKPVDGDKATSLHVGSLSVAHLHHCDGEQQHFARALTTTLEGGSFAITHKDAGVLTLKKTTAASDAAARLTAPTIRLVSGS